MKRFQDMALAPELKAALHDLKFENPTEIQEAVYQTAFEGSDLMACAETGSGKTGAYSIPMVSKLIENPKASALILAPTRELVHQIADFIRDLIKDTPDLRATSLVGGADIKKQLRALKKNPRIIVATPGRLIDHLKRQSLKLSRTELLVLDEGDRMLDMGFAPQLNQILKYLPQKRQTMLFSATLPEKVKKLAEAYTVNPKKISVGRASLPVAAIKQSIVQLKHKDKKERILDELNQRDGAIIVFSKTKHGTDALAKNLKSFGHHVDIIHGGRSQGQRNKAIQSFKQGRSRILCATDIAARGIDIPQVEHVINFDLPMSHEDYVHRIGRTARNGAKGEAVSFVTPDEHRNWQMIARKYQIPGVELENANFRDGGDEKSEKRPFRGKKKPKFFKKKFKSKDGSESKGASSGRRPSRGGSGGKRRSRPSFNA
ncbi:MAG: DEAD/DEAH box helicase [Bdellovibrionales bacterium]|nr:DEAD/DEAH box helicase [Bdellovibrionales bacterium]